MKKTLLLLLLILISCTSCFKHPEIEMKESGDFRYQIIESKNNDAYVRIMYLSEEGKKKKFIVVPQFIDGLEVKKFGKTAYAGNLNSVELKKVFVPFKPYENLYDVVPSKADVFILVNEISSNINIGQYQYITSYHYSSDETSSNTVPQKYVVGGTYYFANVSYFYNYEDAPNSGYYWIDDYSYGEKIEYIPDNPYREGYIFDGWYKESECINKWDFNNDKLPEKAYGDKCILYQETRLYAKWVL